MQHAIGLQTSFLKLTADCANSAKAVGAAGEILVARALESSGYQVALSHTNGDLRAVSSAGEVFYVEVKTARKGRDKAYRFTLYKYWQNRVCTDHRNADFVVLVCLSKAGNPTPFVVPCSAIGNRSAVAITSDPRKYQGWLSPYRQFIRSLALR